MNKLILISLTSLLSFSTPTYSEEDKNPFDVSEAQFNAGIGFESFIGDYVNDRDGRLAGTIASIPGSNQLLSMYQGMERYAEEMTDWYDYMEYMQELEEATRLNADRTDNYAYELLSNTRIYLDTTGDGVLNKRYRHEDIISGSDWDNNGIIDVFDHPGYSHYQGQLSIR